MEITIGYEDHESFLNNGCRFNSSYGITQVRTGKYYHTYYSPIKGTFTFNGSTDLFTMATV